MKWVKMENKKLLCLHVPYLTQHFTYHSQGEKKYTVMIKIKEVFEIFHKCDSIAKEKKKENLFPYLYV